MNVYECNGTNIFHEVKDEMFTLYLSPIENMCSIARTINIHYLFYITCTKIQKIYTNLQEKALKNDFSSSKH